MKTKSFTKKSLCWPVMAMAGLFFTHNSYSQSSISVSINANDDDMEEFVNSKLIDPGSSDLEMITEGAGPQIIGLRFNNVALPKNAVISNAYIMFGADEANAEPTSLVIKGQAADNPGTFTTTDKVSTRTLGSDSVRWDNIPAWAVDDYTDAQKTPNLKNIVQSIINRTGWAKNNSMVFVLKGSGKRVADAFDEAGPTTKPAKLVVEYFVPVTMTTKIAIDSDDMEEYVTGTAIGTSDVTSSDLEMTTEGGGQQIIGFRFTNIGLAKNAVVQNAFITFGADETHSEATNLAFKIQNTDSAATFSGTANIVSARPWSADSVKWENVPAWVANDRTDAQKSPNLASLVQAIVNRTGWKKNNAIAFLVSGTGKRVADSHNEAAEGATTKYAELTITYLGNDEGVVVAKPKYTVGTFPVLKNGSWKYASGADLSAENWSARSYAKDSNWVFSKAKFGYGVSGLGTVLDTVTSKPTTYYFRNTFKTTAAVADFDSLIFFANANDGMVVYINGVEAKRVNMPSGAVNNTTLALTDMNMTARFVVKNTLLANDTNTIAIEVHAASLAHTNLSFDVEVAGKTPAPAVSAFPIKKNSVWSAFDQGQDLGTAWKNPGYSVANWVHGAGVLGYSDPVTTTLWFGDNSSDKFPTTYFRKEFSVSDLSKLTDSLELNMRVDDGAVVYINGTEVLRVNMPAGVITYATYSSASPVSETTYYSYKVSKSVFVSGNNVIAVEVHQDSPSSSDVTFDLELKSIPTPPVVASGCNGPNDDHISCFTSVPASSKNQLLNIPTETHTMQVLVQSGYAYNAGAAGAVSTNSDFTGYVPDNMTSTTKGHLSINHETAVGAVSMLDLHYDMPSKLWVVDSAQGIDFTGVAGTNRNCSGGVTPWGTIITSEETRTAVDSDLDGYFDHGWNVEIDPKTNKIPTYGTGKAQKLWAVGRASHENVVVAQDSLTLYWGEDAGDGHVYKFVADQKMNMYAGKLYALKLVTGLVSSEPTATTGEWIAVPNTTQADRNNTYSIAKALGATQFNGVEDVEIHPLTGKIYFTAKGNNRTFRFKDNGTTVAEFETFVGGQSYTYIGTNGQTITEAWGSGNDNLTFDDRGNLYVLQDGSQDHVWMVRNDHTQENPKVELFATSPEGSEPTGMTFSPDYKYAFISMQNPSATNTATFTDAAGKTYTMNKSTTLVISRLSNLAAPVITSVDDAFLNNSNMPMVYPNPTEGTVNIHLGKRAGVATIEISTISGVLVSKTSNTFDAGQVSQMKLNAGIYLVKISTENGTTTEKVIVK